MKAWKRALSAALALCMTGILAACGGGLTEKDAEAYVKGHLDAAYLGVYDKAYIELVEDMTEADAREMHENNVSDEAELYLLDFLEVDYPTDEINDRAKEVMEKLYAKSKYTVGTGSKTKDGDFVVEVTVSPIDLYNLLTQDDFFDALDEANFDDAETEEELEAVDAVFGLLILDTLEDKLDEIEYGEDQIIMLQLKKDSDGYYGLVEAGMQKVDEVMIDYSGAYTK
ncbi:MAG: hypothetical protein HFF42_11125 [Lawsonibacter sp.]|jgi:hypothetical protein|nr:hypothetical protein [Lawsonibacter sp.]